MYGFKSYNTIIERDYRICEHGNPCGHVKEFTKLLKHIGYIIAYKQY